ncbi:hypothetical protein PAESOLCIP111_01570 [Paenibacillus solanacearum]|uniref:DUF11 domain-containing protein n=1 Tax=Paenibacillus solanacearum TaxID=2048548 RepID=A0A916JZK8_9BACL|nr:hypothetical protein [Paenibacillus solanacearum]CAG7613178.1 hypothetical protein PAESOLCIP111_01570 [Paenibacillus solanacearum]
MIHHWNKAMAAFVILASILAYPVNLVAADNESVPVYQTVERYALNESVQVEVKSILNERAASGTQIGVVIKMFNTGSQMTRVPEYDLRVVTDTGTYYTLRPSENNAAAIQPQEKVELSYLVTLERNTDFKITSLYWVDKDEFEYPIREKTVLSIPITDQWNGGKSFDNGGVQKLAWKQPFAIPVLSVSLRYTPMQVIHQNSAQGPVAVVTLLVENMGTMKEMVPDIQLDGNTDNKVYHGKRIAATEPVTLEPGEKQQLYYAIPLEEGVQLKSLTVLNQENYVQSDKTVLGLRIGRLNISLDTLYGSEQPVAGGFNSVIAFDSLNKLVPQGVDVSLVELHMHGAEGEGYQMAVAKFKLQNKTGQPLPVPGILAGIRTNDGYNYLGARQSAVVQELIPNLSYVISYSFNLPNSEKGNELVMNLLDGQSAAPYRIPIASFRTQVQKETDDSKLTFYPFEANLNYWSVSTLYDQGKYKYKMNMDLDIKRLENIVVDQNFSKLKIELADTSGRAIGSQSFSFTGVNRLVSGKQSFIFDDIRTDQIENQLMVNIYESIDTPFGEAKRLVKSFKQR